MAMLSPSLVFPIFRIAKNRYQVLTFLKNGMNIALKDNRARI